MGLSIRKSDGGRIAMVLIPEGKSALELAQLWASIAFPIISCGAVAVAIWAIIANRRIQREQTARNAYIKYIELAFQNPKFAFPDWSEIDLEHQTFISDDPAAGKEDFEKYEWFMSILLNTANFVFTAVRPNHVLAKMRVVFPTDPCPSFLETGSDRLSCLCVG